MGRDVVDSSGDKVGSVEGVYIDDVTGEPNWLAVKTRSFGSNVSFVPFQGTYVGGDEVVVSYPVISRRGDGAGWMRTLGGMLRRTRSR